MFAPWPITVEVQGMKRTPIKQKRSKPRRGPMRDAKYRSGSQKRYARSKPS